MISDSRMRRRLASVAGAAVFAGMLALPAVAGADSLVTSGSPSSPFPQNKQNEPTVAIDPLNSNIVVAGSNDEIDLAPCTPNPTACPFTHGVGTSGFYYSTNGGGTWFQPTYSGFSARTGTGGTGPIGTLPNYDTAGVVSDGDPVLVFGPRPDASGHFSWGNGVRVYYGNLTSNFATVRTDQTFKGFEAIAVSHADNLAAVEAGSNSAWSAPVIVSSAKQSSATFSDKDDIWADNAATSPHFGTVYACYSDFRSASLNEFPDPTMVSHSTDGGVTWTSPVQVTPAVNNNGFGGRQGCAIATDSNGVVYVFVEGAQNHHSVQFLVKSFDGGKSFTKQQAVASVVDVGGDADTDMDGVQGARTDSFPSVSIANRAPTGAGAPNTIALAWDDAAGSLNHEQFLYQLSGDGGNAWTAPANAAQGGDRPMMPAVALSPNGQDLYFTYNALLQPFQNDTSMARTFQGVVRHASLSGTTVSGLSTLTRGSTGDARASSANALTDEFLGDYNTVVATNSGAVAVYNDARNAADCPAIDTYREGLLTNPMLAAPFPPTGCPATFGNTDIFAAAVAKP